MLTSPSRGTESDHRLGRAAATTLANGLRVFAVEDRTVPAVAVNLWYRVGSRDEVAGRTGLAHLFEHLMFQGSAHVAPGDHAGLLLDCGGTFNATTSFERTNYFETVPAGALRLALWLEADRMATLPQALTQTNLDAQRDVVRNERRQRYDNVPYGSATETLVDALFGREHAYGHLPIGSMDDLAAASREDAISFFERHYAPGNAVLTVVGDVDAEAALELCAEYFDPVPAGPPAPVVSFAGQHGSGVREIVRTEPVPSDAIFLAFPAPAFGSQECDAADLAMGMFGSGTSSFLYQRLVRNDGMATAVSAGLIPLVHGPSIGIVNVEVADGVDPARARAATIDAWHDFGTAAVQDRSLLDRSVALAERGWLEEMSTLAGRADAYSQAITFFADPSRALDQRQRIAAVSQGDVAAAVESLELGRHHVALTYRREGDS
jgi:predicted Zn-dependent peptidase